MYAYVSVYTHAYTYIYIYMYACTFSVVFYDLLWQFRMLSVAESVLGAALDGLRDLSAAPFCDNSLNYWEYHGIPTLWNAVIMV